MRDKHDHVYKVRLPSRCRWTGDYRIAFEVATGQSLTTIDDAERPLPGEKRISILHKRGREYVLDLSTDEEVIANQEVCMNRTYDCGHAAYGPPHRLPSNCPECRPIATDGGHPFDPANLQTLCSECHQDKTARENSKQGQTTSRGDLSESLFEYVNGDASAEAENT